MSETTTEQHGKAVPTDLPRPGGGTIVAVVTAFAVVLAGLFVVGLVPARREQAAVRRAAADRAGRKPVVQWLHPVASTGERSISLPCDVVAYRQTALYPRASGYLKSWSYDIGQHVEAGAVMAVIDTPEVDAQLLAGQASLEQARASVNKAKADRDLARVTLTRYADAQKTSPGSVTQEDVDVRRSTLDNTQAALAQAEANVKVAAATVEQLQTQVGFEKIVAPFAGTVTARTYDVGRLLSPADVGPGKQIFDLQQTDKLRVFVNVPQGYANDVKAGRTALLAVRNFPGRHFEGTVALTTGAIDPNTRTLRVQIDVDNAAGELFAGSYGQVELPVTPQRPVMVIRSSALVFSAAGTDVAVLGDDGRVHIKPITIGRDLGTDLQVTGGLTVDDRVILNSGERTGEGAEVDGHEAPADEPAAKPATGPTTRP